MDKKEMIEKIAPCSLMCYTCEAYEQGIICSSARTLAKYMEGMKQYHEQHDPELIENYKIFEERLMRCCHGPCSGCRNGGNNFCSIKGCRILDCTKQHGVDFCGECNEFPCKQPLEYFEKEVYDQWLNGNQRIKDIGVEAFWIEKSNISHFNAYIK